MNNYFLAICFGFLFPATADDSRPIDAVTLGDRDSETKHLFKSELSDVIHGGLGQPARRLLPRTPASWDGGRLSVRLNVDPEKPNYLTVRLWGDDVNANRLNLVCDGKQVGYRHLGDVEMLDMGTQAPVYHGRFCYNTTPLPLQLTRGKTAVAVEIRSTGRIWGYGNKFEDYQHSQTDPTRGVYALYTHTDGCFAGLADEKQGAAPAEIPVRKTPGIEVLELVKKRVNREVDKLLSIKRPLDQVQMHLLARAYYVKWTAAFQNSKVADQLAQSLDALYVEFRKNPKLAQSDPRVYNGDWFGMGLAGDAVRLLAGALQPHLDRPVAGASDIKRRAAWSEMLQASRDWHRQHRRLYTNQTMINDLNVYRANRGVAAIDPPRALAEDAVRRYLYESIGLQPWLGSDTDKGSEKPLGEHYWQLTEQGLTKELGYVGNYGEVLDWATQIYDATREPGQLGDEKIKAQLARIAHARAVFRYPQADDDGNRAMRIETVVGWRDDHFPGDVTYGERTTWDASALYTAAVTLDPEAVGYAQQMFADNQFFKAVEERMHDGMLRVTAGLLNTPDEYALLQSQPPSPQRLPMSAGQPDLVFSDVDDGVVAIHRGDEILYVSLYWRARYAVNFLARVHYLTPTISRVAVVREETEFEPSGLTYSRADWTDRGYAGGGFHYPDGLHSALAGEKLPIAKILDGQNFKPGNENAFAGRGSFYRLQYGNYLIGMNTTTDKTFELRVPVGQTAADLVARKRIVLTGPIKLPPRATAIFWLGEAAPDANGANAPAQK